MEQQELNRLRKKRWRFSVCEEVKNRVKKYDRERKRTRTAEESMSLKEPTYYSILNKSKEVRSILGESPKTHTSVLKHVLKHSNRSPRKARLLNYSPRASKFITPHKEHHKESRNIPSTLQKIAILRSK